MSVTRHHADWLSLIEVSGPFVSLPVLVRVFPQGLDPRDHARAKVLRAAYEEWQDNPTAPGKQRAWVMHVLTGLLGFPQGQIVEGQVLPAGLEANMPEMGETLRPDFALVSPAGIDTAGQAQLLIVSYPAGQALDKPVTARHWKATPSTRMMELLHGANVPLGLITNGEHWMLVYAPRGETTGYASWYGALWLDEPITLRAFHSLIGVRRFFGVAASNTLLAMLKESAQDQQEVTDQLGYQVREAVEVLVQSFDALDSESNQKLLGGITEQELYNAALTIMMRLVFLFSAEERGLLHLGKPIYDDNYAVSTLQEQLQEVADHHGEEVLERRSDAWARLLATFRAVHSGIQHQDLLIPAYGGSLFDPDRYPLLEGRPAGSLWRGTPSEPLSVNNRVVLHLLNSLQRLRTKVGAGTAAETRRVSFRALGVEQIGHVYEGLLDHTAVRASELVLGIKGTRSKEPEIPLSTLESQLAQGKDKLCNFLREVTGRSVSALRRALEEGSLLDEHKLLVACSQDETFLGRLRPFAGLIRDDSFGRPLVVLPGSVYVTAGTARRSTGTHYTPPSLTEPIVQHTLEPLVYVGPAEGWPRAEWQLKPPKAILDLRVCDMAMGSGAFLVQACRYLAERLMETWENEEKKHPGQVLITPDGKFSIGSPSERLVPADASERISIARRVVADRCLYGVDINPMAVEMAKLSLWLITVDRDRPFTFLDHAFKCGDSLLGINSLEQLERFSLRPDGGKQMAFATLNLWRNIDEANKKRKALEAMASDTPEQISAKAALYTESEEEVAKLSAAADVLVAVELKGLKGRTYEAERAASVDHLMTYWAKGQPELQRYASMRLRGRRCLHWALAFPEIILGRGFDAFVGNPPFLGGKKISGNFGEDYRNHIAYYIGEGRKGVADLSVYFMLRAFRLIRNDLNSTLGLIITSSIAEGDSREVGLDHLSSFSARIIWAEKNKVWPGTASVTYSSLVIQKGSWEGVLVLDGQPVEMISSSLTIGSPSRTKPYRLDANAGLAFIGTYILGTGFTLEAHNAQSLLRKNPGYADVLFPFLSGGDMNEDPLHRAPRWIICFFDWPLDRHSAPIDYKGQVAADFPELLEIVRREVKPLRDSSNRKVYRERWWQFGEKAVDLYKAIRGKRWVLGVASAATKYVEFAVLPPDIIYAHSLTIIPVDNFGCFALLTSDIHKVWVRENASYNLSLIRYTPSDCLGTFPFPADINKLTILGDRYHAHRKALMLSHGEGLTKTYNRFHNETEANSDILELRRLHVEMDRAVAAAYGWQDLDLGHGFHDTKQGIRFSISESARLEVLDRLLALNHQQYVEEVAAGRHDKKARKISDSGAKRGRKKKTEAGGPTQTSLFSTKVGT